jgi:hypothetical protein
LADSAGQKNNVGLAMAKAFRNKPRLRWSNKFNDFAEKAELETSLFSVY